MSIDVDRLAKALCAAGVGHYRGWDAAMSHATVAPEHDEDAAAIAAEYDALTAELRVALPPSDPRLLGPRW